MDGALLPQIPLQKISNLLRWYGKAVPFIRLSSPQVSPFMDDEKPIISLIRASQMVS
jgi:hypothetical protein